MLYLLFQLGPERFAFDVAEVTEVLPVLRTRPLPQAPTGVVGVFDYHGATVPLLDLCLLAHGTPISRKMSTRVVIVPYRDGDSVHPLGLLVERATETLRREASDFSETGVRVEGTPWLGPVTRDARGLIQRVEVSQLLPEGVREILFRREALCS